MKKIVLFLILMFPCILNAEESAYLETFNINTNYNSESDSLLGDNTQMYHASPSKYYEFIDIDGLFNVIYTIKDNNNILGWVKTDTLGNKISEITINRYLSKFGNAIYKDGYLYVIYGDTDKITTDTVLDDFASTITISLVKYDSLGNVVKELKIPAYGTSSTRYIKNLNDIDAKMHGTKIAFDASNIDMAISNNILAASFSKEMYNTHQMNFTIYVDINTFEYLNSPDKLNNAVNINEFNWVSHVFDQRIISTSSGSFIHADQGDNFPRGFVITKSKVNNNTFEYKRKLAFSFRASTVSDVNQNYTFASLGNIIEVSDGYVLVASSEKTYTNTYASTSLYNEPRNIFIQKFDEELNSVLDTPLRQNEENDTDYGVKWITNYIDNKTITGLRAVSLDNDKILIIYQVRSLTPYKDYYSINSDKEFYYMIINTNGEEVLKPIPIEKSYPTILINYIINNNIIYWVNKYSDNTLQITKLYLDKYDEKLIFERVGEENIEITDSDIKNIQLSVNTNKNTPLKWYSSNNDVATVENGNVLIKKSGEVKITVENEEYNKSITYNININHKMKSLKEVKKEVFIKVGSLEYLEYEILPSTTKNKEIKWIVENNDIVKEYRTNMFGTLFEGLKEGTTKVVGNSTDGSNLKIEYIVHVYKPLTSIKFKENPLKIYSEESVLLELIKDPVDSLEPVTYSVVSGTDIASVNGEALNINGVG